MIAYVVFDVDEHKTGAGFVHAVFTDFQKARKYALDEVLHCFSNKRSICVESYDVETGEYDHTWYYEELIVMEVNEE